MYFWTASIAVKGEIVRRRIAADTYEQARVRAWEIADAMEGSTSVEVWKG